MVSRDDAALGDLVREHRLRMGLTQEQLAARAGVASGTIRGIETGRVKQPYKLRDVFRALGVEFEEEPVSLAYLSDDELVREFKRRFPGKLDEILHDDPPRQRPPNDRPGQTGRTA
jgi:transcriptional regulator with XRE-family HTH domain